MKKIFYAAMLLLGLSILCSCNKENNGSSGSIIGEWQPTKSEAIFQGSVVNSSYEDWVRYDFHNDGNVMMTDPHSGEGYYLPYLYDTKLGQLTILGQQWEINLSSSTMVLTDKVDWFMGPPDEEYKATMYKGTEIYCDREHYPDNFWYYRGDEKIPVQRPQVEDYFYDEVKEYFSRVK
ncbi:MAG: hypothetical protein MJY48_03340 [Bacteroidales bacterium]|nr:hypothetical protein [Bacteroidales bacterium]